MATPLNRDFVEFVRLARVLRVNRMPGPIIVMRGLLSMMMLTALWRIACNDNRKATL